MACTGLWRAAGSGGLIIVIVIIGVRGVGCDVGTVGLKDDGFIEGDGAR